VIGATSRVVERAIEVEDGTRIGVRAQPGRIVVRWFCGEKRSFSPEQLAHTIGDLELLEPYPDVWVECVDSDGCAFMAQLRDGELHANQLPIEGGHVPWRALKKTLKKMG
jgi:hypothetical protein